MLEPLERAMAGLGTGFGVACAMLAFVHEQASGAAVVVVWLAISALVLALNRVQSHARLDVFGLGALGATVLAWLASPVREGWGAPSETAMHLPSLWIGLGIFWLWIAALRWRDVIRARLSGDVIAGAVFPAVMLVMGAEAGLLLSLRWWAGAGESAARIGGLVLTPGATMAGVAAAAWIAAAWLVRGGRKRAAGLPMEERVLAEIATGAGLALAMLALVHEQANGAVVCLAWLAISAAVLALNRVQSHARLEWYGMAALGATLLCWLAVFGNRGWFESAAPAVLHPGLWLAFGIVAVAAGAARFRAAIRARFPAELLIGVAAACVVLLFTATSLEVARVAESAAADIRARKAAVSVWWGLFAIGLIAGGFWWRIPAARYAGLGLLAFATGKALVYDMLNASPGLRVASLVGLGLFMMGVAVAYSRLSARFGGPGTERRTADEE